MPRRPSARLAGFPDLPVVPVLDELGGALSDHKAAVLVAPPGAGKTTLVPLALLDADWRGDRKIIVLEPRRLAARSAARWMASLLGEDDVGGTVGYRVRMDTRVGPATRIEVVTEGVLTRMLLDDPALTGVGVVVFDEFHERSIHADLGLALALQSRELLRDDLRLLVMSATLDPAPVSGLLGGAPVVRSEGRSFPVETRFRERAVDGWIEPATVSTVLGALTSEEGDVLVFLPGTAEIRRTAGALRDAGLPADVDLYPLYGALPRQEQDRAIAPSPRGRRKVVLATSIAETSLTIEGVRVVVDSGRMRVPRFDAGSGMTRLATVTVTRDAADQRRGRAGRTAPGVCYRMWTEGDDRGLIPARRPEIEEADLAPLALDLAVWGARPGELQWMTDPPEAAMAQAQELLRELDALDEGGVVTPHGRELAGRGIHPRLAHMLVRAEELGLAGVACDLAALLEDRDILDGPGRPPDADLRLRLDAMRRARAGARVSAVGGQRVRLGPLQRALQESRHLGRSLQAEGQDGAPQDVEHAGILLAFAYPDRIARRREGGRERYLLRSGKGARLLESDPLGNSEWIVAADLDGQGRDARIFRAAPVDQDEIERRFAHQVRTLEQVAWNESSGRVEAFRRTSLGAIPLTEAPLANPPRTALAAALLDGVRTRGARSLPWTRDTERLRERIVFLHALDPARWPDRSDEGLLADLESWMGPFVSNLDGPRRLDDLSRIDFQEALMTGIAWEDRSRMEALAPTHLEVPSGARVPIDYSDPEAPALEVRLQQVFGMTETPRLGGGRVPLTMKLLSPAHRPVQVTRDLESFWKDAYFEVRKDLRGRYPKHPWPEDPLTAEPTDRAKRAVAPYSDGLPDRAVLERVVQVLVADFHAVRHAGGHGGVSVLGRGVDDERLDGRHRPVLHEGDRDVRVSVAHVLSGVAGVERFGMTKPPAGVDLQERATEPELLATVIGPPAPAEGATHAHVHLADGHAPSRRSQEPPLKQRGSGVGCVHPISGSVERAGHEYGALVGKGHPCGFGSGHHVGFSESRSGGASPVPRACISSNSASRRRKLCSQTFRWCSIQVRAPVRGSGSKRRGRRRPSRPTRTNPASSSTLRCLDTAGWLMSNGSANSETEASPSAKRARIARRVGSARAANVASSREFGAVDI